jgi:SAM-dependent methyltransferase
MSGFSADWLSRREPADHRARDSGLLDRLAAWTASRDSLLRIVDLGCGTGSNARAVVPRLSATQHWRLVDYDPALLAAASEKTAALAGTQLQAFTFKTEQADFAHGVDALLATECDLVTAAALFDLVSKEWLDGLVAILAARKLPLYTVLIYDGAMEWQPAHPLDEALRRAFNAHQRTDKGFGPAAGPEAVPHLAARLAEAGYDVATASTPWRLGPEDHALLVTSAVGVANAARELGGIAATEIDAWLDFRRREQAGSCLIGHVDVLALPRT